MTLTVDEVKRIAAGSGGSGDVVIGAQIVMALCDLALCALMKDEELIEVMARAEFERDMIGGTAPWDNQFPYIRKRYLKDAEKLCAALRSHGLEVVPVEPTEKMIEAGGVALERGGFAEGVYRAMLKAVRDQKRQGVSETRT